MSALKVKITRVEPLVFRCMPYIPFDETAYLDATPSEMVFPAAGGELELEVSSNTDWEIV